MNKKNQVIFIVSESRSGSTFLSYILGTNPRSAHLGEFFRPYKRSAKTSCRLCEAKGFHQCEIMGDLSTVPALRAHQHALDCFQKYDVNTLIDCSKDLDWIEEIVTENQKIINFKIIHLVRDPRGWIASERRRVKTMTIQAGIERWKNHFRSTSERIQLIELDSIKITYEEILLRKQIALEKLSKFIGFPQNATQYQYWNKEHHGFGGNGAAYNNLADFSEGTCKTGDHAYYKQNHKKTFYDSRWRAESDFNALNNLASDESIQSIMTECGIDFETIDRATT